MTKVAIVDVAGVQVATDTSVAQDTYYDDTTVEISVHLEATLDSDLDWKEVTDEELKILTNYFKYARKREDTHRILVIAYPTVDKKNPDINGILKEHRSYLKKQEAKLKKQQEAYKKAEEKRIAAKKKRELKKLEELKKKYEES